MLIEIRHVRIEYSRLSKQGKQHFYFRNRKVALLLCDCCNSQFERPVKQMDPRRLTDEHTHVCPMCNTKKFAQSRGVESRKFWNTTVDQDIGLGDL